MTFLTVTAKFLFVMYLIVTYLSEVKGEGSNVANGAVSSLSGGSSNSNSPQPKLCLPVGHGGSKAQTLRELLASIPGFSMKVSSKLITQELGRFLKFSWCIEFLCFLLALVPTV